VRHIYDNIPGDESREFYRVPPLIEELARRGWLGDKTGRGFYQRVEESRGESEISRSIRQMDYRPQQKARFASIEAGRAIEDTRERLRMLVARFWREKRLTKRKKFIWGVISEMCLYAARRVPEIQIRLWTWTARCAGLRWNSAIRDLDAIGAESMPSSSKMRQTGCAAGHGAFRIRKRCRSISPRGARRLTSILASQSLQAVPQPEGIIILKSLKERAERN